MQPPIVDVFINPKGYQNVHVNCLCFVQLPLNIFKNARLLLKIFVVLMKM